jgi:surface antigen
VSKSTYMMLSVAVMAVAALSQPVSAQSRAQNRAYNDGYDRGYQEGFNDAQAGRRYDSRIDGRFDGRFGDPDARKGRWRNRYQPAYTYVDDNFYQQCRQTVDPGGVIAGALIGGLLGNTVARGGARAPATVAGVILGGATGAALTRNLSCDDRSYAYRAYYDGFNSNRPNSRWDWRNPNNGNYGEFQVGDYYDDPDGFRCSTYSQRIFVNGRSQTSNGRACQQPDGNWTIVS